MPEWKPLLLLILANGTPIVLRDVLRDRYAWPIDQGIALWDGRSLFGPSKTWRGVVGAVCSCLLAAPILGYAAWVGAVFGLCTMLGDLLSSFIKRRCNIPTSGKALGLDQIPESIVPLLILHHALGLTLMQVLFTAIAFVVLDWVVSPLLYRLHIRNRPY